MAKLSCASVHGRFQPFHNGHLDYLKQAFQKSEFVYVGVTQIFHPEMAPSAGAVRDTPSGNPLTYFERVQLIDAALAGERLDQSRYSFTPFPIETPERLPEFMPIEIPCFTTKLNAWNDKKIELLESLGYSVSVLNATLPDDIRVATGSHIRELIRARDNMWKKLVPGPVAERIERNLLFRFAEY
jgi:cytidyltransferase-like protein